MKRQYVYFIAAALIAGANAWAASTGMPWEQGLGKLADSMTGFVGPAVTVASGTLALIDAGHNHGSLSGVGSTALRVTAGGLAGCLFKPAMNLFGVTAATV